jgi:hypothetical protein
MRTAVACIISALRYQALKMKIKRGQLKKSSLSFLFEPKTEDHLLSKAKSVMLAKIKAFSELSKSVKKLSKVLITFDSESEMHQSTDHDFIKEKFIEVERRVEKVEKIVENKSNKIESMLHSILDKLNSNTFDEFDKTMDVPDQINVL